METDKKEKKPKEKTQKKKKPKEKKPKEKKPKEKKPNEKKPNEKKPNEKKPKGKKEKKTKTNELQTETTPTEKPKKWKKSKTPEKPQQEGVVVTGAVEAIVQAKVSIDKSFLRDEKHLLSQPPYDVDPDAKEPRIFFGVDPSRQHWSNRVTYIAALCSTVVTLRNLYRFPLLTYKYGADFLFVYAFCMVLIGYPLHLLMITIGIYAQRGLVKAWDSAPIARGIGWSMFLLSVLALIYMSFYGAYSLLWWGRCFYPHIPWKDLTKMYSDGGKIPSNIFSPHHNMCMTVCSKIHSTTVPSWARNLTGSLESVDPWEYFETYILRYRDVSDKWAPLVFHWKLVFAIGLTWAALCLIVLRGIKSVERMNFFIIPCIYFLGILLLTTSWMLKNRSIGYSWVFQNFGHHMGTSVLWRDAVEQVLLELGICYGVPIIYGSFVNFRNRIPIDSAIVCTVSSLTSFCAFLMVAATIGNVKVKNHLDWDEMDKLGARAVYILFFDGFTNVGGKHLWCFCCGLLLYLATLTTLIGPMLVVLNVLYEAFPHKERKKRYRKLVFLIVCVVIAVLDIFMCFCKAFYVVHLLDWLPGLAPVMPIVSAFVAVILIYGIHKYAEDTEFATEWYPWMPLKYYYFGIPGVLFLIFLISLIVDYYSIVFEASKYGALGIAVGWLIFFVILAPIPAMAILWIVVSLKKNHADFLLRSKMNWGPRHIIGRYARARFSSEP